MKTVAFRKEIKVATTAHRPHKLNNEYDHIGPCSEYVRKEYRKKLISSKATIAITGMAIGGDTLFALEALDLGLKVWAAIPFDGQEKKWPRKSQDLYNKILSNPLVTSFYISEPGYANYKFQVRNEWMVDECDLLVAVYDGTTGGTHNTVKYAEKVGKPLEFINPNGWRELELPEKELF